MAVGTLGSVFSRLGNLMGRESAATPDQELLARFLDSKDQDAFAAIMRRHGTMVLAVCQRILRNPHDAEDACQAVFLVLARKAASIRNTASIAGWLHGVAWLVANKLRTKASRQSAHEKAAASAKPAADVPPDITWREVQRLVDEEVRRLPKVFAEPLILCYLEGRTQDEAAAELQWSLSTLRGRLKRARDMLRTRLTRRGVVGASAIGMAALLPGFASAMTPELVAATAAASVPIAAGQSVALPAHVLALSREALQFSTFTKLTLSAMTVSVFLALAILGTLATDLWSAPPSIVNLKPRAWRQHARLDVPDLHVWCVAYSPDGKRIAAGSAADDLASGELRMWDADSHEIVFVLKTPRPVRCIAFSPDGKTMATAEHDGMARIRDANNGDVLFTLRGHQTQIDSVSISADGKIAATSSWDQTVKLWNMSTGEELQTLRGHHSQVFNVTFGGPDGAFASGGVDRQVRIWRPDTSEPIFTMGGHDGVVHWLTFAPDGKTLASASWDKSVKLWDAAKGVELATLNGHTSLVHCVAFAPDGKRLASSAGERLVKGKPGEIILWDVAGQKALDRIEAPDRVFGLAFAPHGATLAAACWDGSVILLKENADAAALDVNDANFVIAAAQPRDDETPDLKKDYAQDFHPNLKGAEKEIRGVEAFGPDKDQCVLFEPDGLRIALPLAYPRQRSGTGVVTDFGVKGDFEITAAFEILQEPNVGVPGLNPTDFKIVVVPKETAEPEVWQKSTQNRAQMARYAAGRGSAGLFMADITKWNSEVPKDQWGNDIFTKVEMHGQKPARAVAKSGALRLVRAGNVLYFLMRDGDQPDFTLMHKGEFSTKDLKNVRLVASTGGPADALEVRVTDFQIRADGFEKASEAPAPAAPAASNAGGFWWPILLAPIGVLILAMAAVGGWLLVRARGRTAPAASSTKKAATSPTVLSFTCANCNKRLKIKAQSAGKKVKCPHCHEFTQAPKLKREKTA